MNTFGATFEGSNLPSLPFDVRLTDARGQQVTGRYMRGPWSTSRMCYALNLHRLRTLTGDLGKEMGEGW